MERALRWPAQQEVEDLTAALVEEEHEDGSLDDDRDDEMNWIT